jgi:hypothetical protein
MVIAEEMVAGIPVITVTTSERDNAQIELVNMDFTGFLVERVLKEVSAALSFMYNESDTRSQFARRGIYKVLTQHSTKDIVRSLEQLILLHFQMSSINTPQSSILNYSGSLFEEYVSRSKNIWRSYGEYFCPILLIWIILIPPSQISRRLKDTVDVTFTLGSSERVFRFAHQKFISPLFL